MELHPLHPFLPAGASILFLGSFPPPRQRWCMEFFYPNWINDFWRIQGLIHYNNKEAFVIPGEKRFDRERIVAFCEEHGLAFFDTAMAVNRLKDNASDAFLEIVQPTDIPALLEQLSLCVKLVTTGGKASEQVCHQFGIPQEPSIGTSHTLHLENGRTLEWWRMPSTSRAYPLALEKKAEYYRKLWNTRKILATLV
jgi:G:T/U-mismatch repair DNA glycosylase